MSARVVDQNVFRDVIGRFASGVTVITTRVGDADYGTTASAVSSLSMDPPMLLICMNRTSETGQAIHESGHFTVNILGEDQGEIAERFATKGADKFGGVEIERGLDDLPHVANALGHLDCLVAETATGGTHTVFLSLVEHASATEGSPLTYYRGRFGRFEDTAQEAVYQQLRGMVMAREVAVGAPLDIDELAASLELERPRLQYALMKLTTDGLVVAELRGYANAAITSVEREPPDYAQLRDAGRRFHRTLIGLTGNDTLVDMYQRLRIDSIWGRLLKGRHLNPDYLAVIPEALVAGDATAAKQAIRAHAQHATAVVEEMIAKAGGTI
jgi:flavin reductase (DIM6/NTAB) family NADH-FMN oxidoreductase RutF/DNA-binding GntR family transcriptional regulator